MKLRIALILFLLGGGGPAWAAGAAEIQASLENEARAADPGFRGFSAARGENFYRNRHGGDWSCSSCHTDNPASSGNHAVTRKSIKPLAPAANAERFADLAKVEKWFKRNCNDVLKRACTVQEKGDFVAYLLSVKP
jgi:hypothetical protein